MNESGRWRPERSGSRPVQWLTVIIPGDRQATVKAGVRATRMDVQVTTAAAGVDRIWWHTDAVVGEREHRGC